MTKQTVTALWAVVSLSATCITLGLLAALLMGADTRIIVGMTLTIVFVASLMLSQILLPFLTQALAQEGKQDSLYAENFSDKKDSSHFPGKIDVYHHVDTLYAEVQGEAKVTMAMDTSSLPQDSRAEKPSETEPPAAPIAVEQPVEQPKAVPAEMPPADSANGVTGLTPELVDELIRSRFSRFLLNLGADIWQKP